jgi:type IV pilus assembly protein PilX
MQMAFPTVCQRQQGASLIVVLIIIVLMTIIGLVGMNTAFIEEKMAGNSREQSVAFAAAEAALSDGEQDVMTSGRISGATGFAANCSADSDYVGLCSIETGVLPWDAVDWSATSSPAFVTYGAKTNDNKKPLPGVANQPRYILEALPNTAPGNSLASSSSGTVPANKYIYRLTAIGYGADPSTRATVQSVYLLP